MKKRLIFEVEEGNTNCLDCPIYQGCQRNESLDNIPCDMYNLSTIKFIEINEEDS